jgi:hypothetical protein
MFVLLCCVVALCWFVVCLFVVVVVVCLLFVCCLFVVCLLFVCCLFFVVVVVVCLLLFFPFLLVFLTTQTNSCNNSFLGKPMNLLYMRDYDQSKKEWDANNTRKKLIKPFVLVTPLYLPSLFCHRNDDGTVVFFFFI